MRSTVRMKAQKPADQADSGPAKPGRVQKPAVVGMRPSLARRRVGIAGIDAGQGSQHRRGVRHRPGHGSGRILVVGNGNDPGPADESHGRLDAYDPVGVGRTDDGAVGPGSDGGGAEIGRDGHSRAGAGSAGIAVQGVGIPGEAAASAPAAGGAGGTEVGPLAEVGLPQQDRPRFPELARHDGVPFRNGSLKRQRPGGGRHSIGRIDVVLDQDGDAVKRSPDAGLPPCPIQGIGDGEGLGIDFDDGSESRPPAVDLVDTAQVFFCNGVCRFLTRVHTFLNLEDGDLVQIEGSDGWRILLGVMRRLGPAGRGRRRGGCPQRAGADELAAIQVGRRCCFAAGWHGFSPKTIAS